MIRLWIHKESYAIVVDPPTNMSLDVDLLYTIRVRMRFRNLSVFSIHAPTEDKEEEQKEEFYELLEGEVENTPNNDIKRAVADFNAGIHTDSLGATNVDANGTILNKKKQIVEYADDLDLIARFKRALRKGYKKLKQKSIKKSIMPQERMPRRIIRAVMIGYRTRERPSTRWRDNVRKGAESMLGNRIWQGAARDQDECEEGTTNELIALDNSLIRSSGEEDAQEYAAIEEMLPYVLNGTILEIQHTASV
ncbi:hypothetical protein ILUMI_25216 [Ignelater luminosus]|uniref:Uncharacterized protein n=1 Tax=Ignelater luminosus TaxID=2038154 RepID=A0A8K0CAY9_IGNLU|nr:hypothetical protein ILUMI_25216 [Ignelater luminosus]